MMFDTVAIVGVGLIGGSIGLALKERRLARRVVGVGRRQLTLSRARRLGAIDQGTLKLSRGVADAELAVFCTPVDTIAEQVGEAAEHCLPRTILTDAGSTKARIVARLESGLPDRVSFVGSHPLAGSEKRGVEESRPDLFDGRVCVVTPTPNTPREPLQRVEQFWRSLGARVIRMTPHAHDLALAYTSHLPHLAAAGLCIALPDQYNHLVASGFRDTTRIAASDPDLWAAIFLENAGPLLEALTQYERALREIRYALECRDKLDVRRLWVRSLTKRRRLAVHGDEEQAADARTIRAADAGVEPWEDAPIPWDKLSVRSRKALQRLGVAYVGELVMYGPMELLTVKNFGVTSLREVETLLREFGVPADRWDYDLS